MSRFQSYLFNWIKRSFPVELGRKARRAVERIKRDLTENLVDNLVDKIAHILGENEAETHPPNPVLRKLLKPVYSLVKNMSRGSTITKEEPKSKHIQVLEEIPTLAVRNVPTKSKLKVSLEELFSQAFIYFSQKKRTLPSTKDDRLATYYEITDDQSAVNLIQLQPPSPIVATISDEPPQTIETWESEIDNYSMRAWIETQAISLGYADSPIIKVLLWLDKLIAKIEQWFIKLWQTIVEWLLSKFTNRG
jgi:hypothetical protein